MTSHRALTLMELLIAVVVAVVLTSAMFVIGRWSRESTPYSEHIGGFHGIDCSANAATRRFCRELGVEP